MAKKKVTKAAQGAASFEPSLDNRVPGELVVKLTQEGEMAVTASIPSGPIRRATVAAPTELGWQSLDKVLAEVGVQSINKVHSPISTSAMSGVVGETVLAESRDVAPGVVARQPSETPMATLARGMSATYRLRLDPKADLDAATKRLARAEGIAEVTPNYYRWATASPNDPMLGVEWGLTKINAPGAWDRTTGSAAVVVAVVDSGVDLDHPDLKANLLAGYDAVDLAGVSPRPGWHWEGDYLTRDNDPQDEVGHGTHVAGTIAAVTNNATGVAGVTWKCKILPVKVLARMVRNIDGAVTGSGTAVDIAFGIRWAADHGAHIINLSLGGYNDAFVEKDAVAYAQAKGCVVVAAMGNDDVSDPHYPAAYPDVVAVGAINQNEQRVSKANTGGRWGSNMGAWIDVVAPGVDIRSTVWDNAYADYSGTSMATPHVSGVAALVKSCKPSLTSAQIADILRTTARPLKDNPADLVPNDRYGYGLVDAKVAVDKACPHCFYGPDCGRAPVCFRFPSCPRAPICYRFPICPRAPICLRLPYYAPLEQPVSGSAEEEPTPPGEGERFVPIVVMVPEKQAAMWTAGARTSLSREEAHQYALQAAEEAYYAALEGLGVSGEYADFPGIEGRQRGSFDPRIKE